MDASRINEILNSQREYFASGETRDIKFRKNALKTLYSGIKAHEREILDALHSDLGKSDFESIMCEIGMTLSGISYMLKNIDKFAKRRKVKTPLAQFAAKSFVVTEPYGNVLIMSPWNYPFLLTMSPLVNAIAAGNTAIIKPSAYSENTSRVIARILGECFLEKFVSVIEGGREENSHLLNCKFDFIFFTGSQSVGKVVLRSAAEHITPCVLELGGKSPCIVDESAKIDLAAKRIVFGKLINCGQTCVAPDYIVCHSSIKDKLRDAVIREIRAQYGENPLENDTYGKIISKKHFDRIVSLIDDKKVVFGGNFDREAQKICPTVMDNVEYTDAVMGEEIFGPIIPILTYDNLDELVMSFNDKQKPLALYIFSENKKNIDKVISGARYGGGCVNDTIIHLATDEMGFGGVGESGMGAYHGKVGFDAFSHKKSIVDKKTFMDLGMRYQPYNEKKYGKLIRFFLK